MNSGTNDTILNNLQATNLISANGTINNVQSDTSISSYNN